MIAAITVGVALSRPPRADTYIYVIVEADTETDAMLAACQIAGCHPGVVMPVSSRIEKILEI